MVWQHHKIETFDKERVASERKTTLGIGTHLRHLHGSGAVIDGYLHLGIVEAGNLKINLMFRSARGRHDSGTKRQYEEYDTFHFHEVFLHRKSNAKIRNSQIGRHYKAYEKIYAQLFALVLDLQ